MVNTLHMDILSANSDVNGLKDKVCFELESDKNTHKKPIDPLSNETD